MKNKLDIVIYSSLVSSFLGLVILVLFILIN
jgi:hypothetical protein